MTANLFALRTLRIALRAVCVGSLWAAIVSPAFAQQPGGASSAPKFDIASIRLDENGRVVSGGFTPDGYTATNVSMRYVIGEAYGVYNGNLLSGGPAWLDTKTFDVRAKFDPAEFPNITPEQRRLMLQQLLADRIQLVVHHEKKDQPVYALEVEKSGPQFKKIPADESADGSACMLGGRINGNPRFRACSAADLTSTLVSVGGLPFTVVDKTGIQGRYNFELRWTPGITEDSAPPAGAAPDLFTALREQLGLKLVPSKAPLDTIVIDHAELPSEN
jgi:uncharacterized protein (TIGR03435 family)